MRGIRRFLRRWTGASLALAVLLAGAPGWGEGPGRLAAQVLDQQAPAPADAQLERTARAFAHAWAMGDLDEVVQHLERGGILLRLEGPPRAALPARQASAALRDYLRPYEDGHVAVARTAPVAGNPDRGFAELRWSARVSGTSDRVERSVYLGLVRHGERWRVSEVRLIP